MVAQPESVAHVVRRNLDRRLADRVGDLGHRMGVRLDDHNSGGRARPVNLQCQGESRNAAADDAHVVVGCRLVAV